MICPIGIPGSIIVRLPEWAPQVVPPEEAPGWLSEALAGRPCHGRFRSSRRTPRASRVLPSDVQAELERLRKENAELKRANAILKDASVYFAQELDPTRRR